MFLIIGKVSYLILVTNTTFNYSIKSFRTKYFDLLCLLSLLFQQFYPQKKKKSSSKQGKYIVHAMLREETSK